MVCSLLLKWVITLYFSQSVVVLSGIKLEVLYKFPQKHPKQSKSSGNYNNYLAIITLN